MKDKEAKSLTKQLTRYAKVGGVVGKLATKLASQRYLGVKLDKEKHASEIRAALGSCLLYTSPSPRDRLLSRMPSSA